MIAAYSAARARLRAQARRLLRLLGAPLRRVLNPRFEALAGAVDAVAAVVRSESGATRSTTEQLTRSIDGHIEALMETADHLGVQLNRLLDALEGTEARLAEMEHRLSERDSTTTP